MARDAFEKAKLFGVGAGEDLGQQVKDIMERQVNDPMGRVLSDPMGMSNMPDLGQVLSSGLGKAGMPGGQDMGLFVKDTPVGDISLGPREGLGFIGSMLVPGGPEIKGVEEAGKASKLGQIAAKADSNIASRAAKFAEQKAANAARSAKFAQQRAASRWVRKPAEEAEEAVAKTASAPVTEAEAQQFVDELWGNKEVGLPAEVTDDRPPSSPTSSSQSSRAPTRGPTLEDVIASRDAPPPRMPEAPDPRPGTVLNQDPDSIEAQKSKLARIKYEAGLEDVPIEFDDMGNPVLPEGYEAPDISGGPTSPLLKSGKGGQSSSRTVLAQRTDLGPTKNAADVAGIQEMEREIGTPRLGNKPATGLEAGLYTRQKDARAQQFLEDQARQYGDNPLKSNAFHDWLTNTIFGSQSKRGPGGEVIWKMDPATGKPLEIDGVKQPAVVYPALYKRVQAADRADAAGQMLPGQRSPHGWLTHQKGSLRKPNTLVDGWEQTPEGRQWLAREMVSIATGPTGQFSGMTARDIAASAIQKQADEMANAANPQNPLTVATSRSDIKPAKLGTSDEPEGLSVADSGRAMGTGDTAHVTQAELEDAGMQRMDPRAPMQRAVDLISTDESSRGSRFDFQDEESQKRFYQLKAQADSDRKLIQEYSDPKSAQKIGVSQDEIDKQRLQAQSRVDDAEDEMSKLTQGASNVDEPQAGEQPFSPILEDARTVTRLRAPRPLPEGMSATVHYGPNAEPVTYTGELPSMGVVTNPKEELARQIADRSVEYVQRQLQFLKDTGAFAGLSQQDKLDLLQQHIASARSRAEIAVKSGAGSSIDDQGRAIGALPLERQLRNPDAYKAAVDDAMAAWHRGEPPSQETMDALRAHGPDSFAYDFVGGQSSDPGKKLQAIRKDIAKGRGGKLVESQQAAGARSLQERPGTGEDLVLPSTVVKGRIAPEAGGVSFQNDAALQAERAAGPDRGQKPAPEDASLKKTFSNAELDEFVKRYVEAMFQPGEAPPPRSEAGPPQRASRAPADPILELLAQQRQAGAQGSAAPLRPNVNLQDLLRRIGIAA
jgi:hypothetical protein